MTKYLIIFIIIMIPLNLLGQNKFTVSGFVNDIENGESLIGVNVIVKENLIGTVSNTYGFIVLLYQKEIMLFRIHT